MKVGTSTAALIPATAKLLSSKNTSIGYDEAARRVTLRVEDTFDTNGDGLADLRRERMLQGMAQLLAGDLRSGGQLVSERYTITDEAAGTQVHAEDNTGSGKLSSVLTLDWKNRTASGERDLNGDGTVDRKVELSGIRVQISTSTRQDGQFDLVESPTGGFSW